MERIFRTVKISDRLPDMGKRVMFIDENYKDGMMHDYNPKEMVEIKKGKFVEIMHCHFVTDYLKKQLYPLAGRSKHLITSASIAILILIYFGL